MDTGTVPFILQRNTLLMEVTRGPEGFLSILLFERAEFVLVTGTDEHPHNQMQNFRSIRTMR